MGYGSRCDDTKITQNIDPWGAKETTYDPPLQKDGWLEGFDNTPRRKLIKEIPPISTLNPPRPLSQALNIDANYVLRKANMDGKVEKRNMKNEKGNLYIPSFLPPKEEPFNIQRDFDIINEKNDFPLLDPPRPLIAQFNQNLFENPEPSTLMKRPRPVRRIVLTDQMTGKPKIDSKGRPIYKRPYILKIGPIIKVDGEEIPTKDLIDQADEIFNFQPPDNEFWYTLYYETNENQPNLFNKMLFDSTKKGILESYELLAPHISTYKAFAVLFKNINGDDRELPSFPDDKEKIWYATYLNSIFDYIKQFINEHEVIMTIDKSSKEYRLKYDLE